MSIRLIVMTLQRIFIANLKKFRRIRGISQMTLAEMSDTTSNYIGQIEMGRRIPSFEKIEKIAAALEVDSYRLFMGDPADKPEDTAPAPGNFLRRLPAPVKKEIISRLLAAINKDVAAAFEAKNYELI